MGSKMDAGRAGGSMRQRRGRYDKDNARTNRIYPEKVEKSAPLSLKKRPTVIGWAFYLKKSQLVNLVEHSTVSRAA